MPNLKLKIVSGSETGQNEVYSFTQMGGSIGRAEECDWTLIDSDRFVSKKHLIISFRKMQFVLTDVSSNGVIVNNSGSPLGRGNEHILQAGDSLIIGKHIVQVDSIDLEEQQPPPAHQSQTDSDLLGLVMGSEASRDPLSTSSQASQTPSKNLDSANPFDNPNPFENPSPFEQAPAESDLGLGELLSTPVQNSPEQPFTKPAEAKNPFAQNAIPAANFDVEQINKPSEPPANPCESLIPDDWELLDANSAPAAFESNKEDNNALSTDNPLGAVNAEQPKVDTNPSPFTDGPIAPNNEDAVEPQSFENDAHSQPTRANAVTTPNSTPVAPNIPTQSATAPSSAHASQDSFFDLLYEKLGLSKEFKASINQQDFADDIATILLSTTQGLMSLLASRTAFKQESRLSSTLIQPRSNNPIKFSIDPVDTLEMLLVKKKKGYKSVEESYNEAVEDIQMHQMAFMAGLQGTLNGVLEQLDPDDIERQVNKKTQRFMNLNSNSQCWQIYKEKQPQLVKTVKENLNEVLGNYFSEAYQSQINRFKQDQ